MIERSPQLGPHEIAAELGKERMGEVQGCEHLVRERTSRITQALAHAWLIDWNFSQNCLELFTDMFDLSQSQRQARERLGTTSARRRRSDAGRSRLRPELVAELRAQVMTPERPSMTAAHRRLADFSRERGWRPPARATLYAALAGLEGSRYDLAELPAPARAALYNLAPGATVPGHQVAFYCFNYGSLAAASFAAGLPWLDLHQAARSRGWRPRSRGLLLAALAARESLRRRA